MKMKGVSEVVGASDVPLKCVGQEKLESPDVGPGRVSHMEVLERGYASPVSGRWRMGPPKEALFCGHRFTARAGE